MSKSKQFLVASLITLLSAAPAIGQEEDCSRPWPVQLPAVPPGDEEAMLELQSKVKDYLDKANEYLACNEDVVAGIRRERAALGEDANPTELDQRIQVWVSRYNNTVDEMHVVGDRFNALVRAFREGDS